MNLVNKIVSTVAREAGELGQDYRSLVRQIERESGTNANFPSKLVSAAMTPLNYAVNHYLGNSYEEERGLSIARIDQTTPSKFKNSRMPGPKGKKKFIKKQVRKDLKKMVKRKPRQGTRYAATSAYKPQGKKFVKGGKRSQVYRVGKSNTRVFAPPTALGFVRSQTNGFSFMRGRRPGCLIMTGRQYLGQLNSVSDGANNWVVLNVQDKLNTGNTITTVHSITQFMVMPQCSAYFGNPVFNMTQMFERYNMKTRLEFKTITGTSTPGSIKLAYYDDPIAFYTQTGKTGWGTASVSFSPLFSDAPTAADMASIQCIKEGSIWKSFVSPWSYSGPRQEMQYVPAPTYTGIMDPAGRTAIDMRQSIEGTWVIGSTGVPAPSGGEGAFQSLGELWINYQLELCDIMSAAPTQAPSLVERKMVVTEDEKRFQRLESLFETIIGKSEHKEPKREKKKNSTKSTKGSDEE